MWKRSKTTDRSAKGQGVSIVHRYIQHFNEVSGNKSAIIKKRSKLSGVMITQSVADIPEGKSTPDFQRKPMSVNIQEGKLAVFKAVVKGDPKPKVTWRRAKGNISDTDKFQRRYDESSGEYTLEIRKVSGADADTYKCYAVNEYGTAVSTATLNVAEVGVKKEKAVDDPSEFRKLLRKSKVEEKQTKKEDWEVDEKFWKSILKAERKDYERICGEFGVNDMRSVLKKLKDNEQEKVEEQCQDGVMIPYDEDTDADKNRCFNIKDLRPEDAGLYQVDAEDADLFTTEFKDPKVDFVVKIQEVKAEEREDALFECVLTHPLPRIKWMGKNSPLQDGEKYSITVSDDKLIHRLLVKDCKQLDEGIYAAVAGIKHCSAWLVVQADSDAAPTGKKKACKTTPAGGAGVDLEKLVKELKIKIQEERKKKIQTAIKAKEEAKQLSTSDGEITAVTRLGKNIGAGKDKPQAAKASALSEKVESKEEANIKSSRTDGTGSKLIGSGCITKEEVELILGLDDGKSKYTQHTKTGQVGSDKVTGQVLLDVHPEEAESCHPFHTAAVDEQGLDHRLLPPEVYDDLLGLDSNEGRYTDGNGDSDGSAKHSRDTKKGHQTHRGVNDSNEGRYIDGNEDSNGSAKHSRDTKKGHQKHSGVNSESTDPNAQSEYDETEDATGSATHSRRKRQGPLIEDLVIDPGVQFIIGLSDVSAIIGGPAEITCKLSSEDCEGAWFRDGKKLVADDNFIITKDGATHELVISSCEEEHSGKYRFEADGRKTEAMINVKDPPRFDPDDLSAFTEPVTVKVGQNTIFKLRFVGRKPMKIQWYREEDELLDDNTIKVEKSVSHSRLLLGKCQRKNTGEIKIKLKNEHGTTEAVSLLTVLDKPTPPLGPTEIIESSAACIGFKWRPPKDDGGSPVISYILERQQVGRNTWKKIGEIPGVPCYRDTKVEHGRRYCYRIRAMTAEGISEMMETDDIQAGTLAFPGPPAPPKVVSASDDCINLSWAPPTNTGGSRILGYIVEKRKKGSNLWSIVNPKDELIKEKNYAVKDVVAGMEYEFRITAINISGAGEFSNPSEFVFARDPKKPPGKVIDLKVTETSYTHLTLAWTKPEEIHGVQDEAKGYYVEVRQAECIEWSRCNTSPIILNSFAVKGLKSMDMYWVRVIATNEGGDSAPQDLANYVLAMPSPVRPRFTDRKMKSFMVMRAGNAVRITVNFEASPRPEIMWQKDNVPVTKRVTISNSDESSQLLIPSSERSDSGVYSILVKNLAGQETFSIEVRVTDDPKPPGPVELEENVPGTVTVTWVPSPDEKRDDRLHYTVSKLDSTKSTWSTVADRLFNNKFTVCNIMRGREYHFRVYAKNDMGISAPSESPIWGMEKKKEKFVVSIPTKKECDLRCAPTFIVPLKLHTAPKGYECYMSCAVKGNPKPRITWYRNNISLNTNTNYYISNTCGVCSMLILHVGHKDMGEYSISAENALGRAECSTMLSVRE
ncbi:immunoglobulin-like and fibronectin type III domain-containing protein 1 [Diretmus argenteus]